MLDQCVLDREIHSQGSGLGIVIHVLDFILEDVTVLAIVTVKGGAFFIWNRDGLVADQFEGCVGVAVGWCEGGDEGEFKTVESV